MLYNNPACLRRGHHAGDARGARGPAEHRRDQGIVAGSRAASPTHHAASATAIVLFAGLDDVALEALMLGARGWVSGLTNAFPRESVALFAAGAARRLGRSAAIYRWFMPLLHLDADPTIWSSPSSSPSRSWDAARSWCACRACAWRAPARGRRGPCAAPTPRDPGFHERGGLGTARRAGRTGTLLSMALDLAGAAPWWQPGSARPAPGVTAVRHRFDTYFFDTLGVGSFAPTTSIYKLLRRAG